VVQCGYYRPATVICVFPSVGPATIVFQVPTGAKVYFDDEPTSQTSATRVYRTPPLPAGRDFHYAVKVEVNQGGKLLTETRNITVRAFSTTRVDLTKPSNADENQPPPPGVLIEPKMPKLNPIPDPLPKPKDPPAK
jgi:uncharacterized protein (TIGR03000 family)